MNHTIHLVQMMLGPDDVIADFGHARNAQEIANELIQEKMLNPADQNLMTYTSWVLQNLIIREEFLAY